MTDSSELERILRAGRETLGIEFKRSMTWFDRATQGKVIRAALAFANNRDGGVIAFGLEEISGNPAHQLIGMPGTDADSFGQDAVLSMVNAHTTPHIDLNVEHLVVDQRRYVAIVIREFVDYPIVCSKDFVVGGRPVVVRGKIYTRSRRMAESTEVQTAEDMRAIIDLATSKGLERYFRLREIEVRFSGPSDVARFREQLGDLAE